MRVDLLALAMNLPLHLLSSSLAVDVTTLHFVRAGD